MNNNFRSASGVSFEKQVSALERSSSACRGSTRQFQHRPSWQLDAPCQGASYGVRLDRRRLPHHARPAALGRHRHTRAAVLLLAGFAQVMLMLTRSSWLKPPALPASFMTATAAIPRPARRLRGDCWLRVHHGLVGLARAQGCLQGSLAAQGGRGRRRSSVTDQRAWLGGAGGACARLVGARGRAYASLH